MVTSRLIEKAPLVVCQALVLRTRARGREVLLSVRSDVRGWELPGGRIEPGEEAREALIREVGEETGLVVEVERHVGDYVRSGFRSHTARVYVCRVISGQERLSSETLDLSWFPIGDIPEGLLPWYRQPIEDGLARDSSPAHRAEYQGLASIWSAMKIDLRMRWQAR